MGSKTLRTLLVLGSMLLVGFTSAAVGPSPPGGLEAWVAVNLVSGGGTVYTNTSGYTATFSVEFEDDPEGEGADDFDFSCSANLGITCSVQPTSATIFSGNSQTVTVTFNTSSQTGTALVGLDAQGVWTGVSDFNEFVYTVAPGVVVTPNSVPSSVTQYAEDDTAKFNVENQTGSSGTFSFTCDWGGGSCTPPDPTYIANTSTAVVALTFDAGSIITSHNLKLTATKAGASGSNTQSVSVAQFLSINAVPERTPVYAQPSTQYADTFAVRFPGQSAATFNTSVTCPGISCSVAASYSVGNTPVKVPVTYTAGANGVTSTITLTVTKAGDPDVTASNTLDVVSTSQILLDVIDANPGFELDRSDCLTVSAGAGAIVCDDFEFVYPLTPIGRLGRSYQIALMNSSSIITSIGTIGADFVLPPGVAEPDSIRATLVVNGVTITTQSYRSHHYAPGQSTRIAFTWYEPTYPNENILTFDVTIEPWSGGVPGTSVSKSGKLIALDHGVRYGRGWWVAGLEKLAIHGDTLIWTGGDLSAGVFIKNGTQWVRQTRSSPDTIVQDGTVYVRRALGGGEVRFSSTGFHEKTIDRNGNETRFSYSTFAGWQRLTSVEVPTPASFETAYTLHYDASTGGLDSIRARTGSGGWSTYRVYTQVYTPAGLMLDSIISPEGHRTGFTHTWGRIDRIYGPAGDTTVVSYPWNTKSDGVTVQTQDVADIVLGYEPASLIGRDTIGPYAPMQSDLSSSHIDGPLPGPADTARIFVTGWGAVRGIRDALGNETWIDRDDPSFPALPTRVRYPNGLEVTTSYTNAGFPDTIIDRSNGAVTTLEWNNTWAAPTRLTSPEGVVTAFVYNGTGNLEKQAVGPDTVRFFYNADGRVDSIADPMGHKTKVISTAE